MPVTASERGLADPFHPAAAIPASEAPGGVCPALRQSRLGGRRLQCGGERACRLARGQGHLAAGDADYVLAVTGHTIEEWRDANPPSALVPDAEMPCLMSIGSLSVAHDPERAQSPASFSRSSGLRSVAGARPGKYGAIGHIQLLRLAADANMTPRAYVQFSLKNSGTDVKDDHLLDPGKATNRARTHAAGRPSL
jgi:hypothetical protein